MTALGMRKFSYEAVAPDGARKKGRMEADSAATVTELLQNDGLIPIDVTPFKTSAFNFDITKPKEERPVKLKPEAVVTYARQLHLLLRAGLAVPRAIQTLGEDAADVRVTRMFNDMSDRTLAGVPLSEAMAAYPGAFDEVFRAYVSAGEATGSTEEAVRRLARMLEKGHQLRLKIKSVTAYPKLVSMAIALLVLGIIMFLVPMYARIYDGFGQKLPGPTALLVKLSSVMSPVHLKASVLPPSIHRMPGRGWLTSPLNFASPMFYVIAGFIGWRRYRRGRKDDIEFGMKLERLVMRLPVLGKLARYNIVYRWSSTMAGALSAGLQAFTALELAGRTSGSYWIQYVTEDLKDAVRTGRPLYRELARHPDLFHAQLRAMAATGEETGEPAIMFENVAQTLEEELEAMVATLGAKIEVVLLMVMGAVVGSLLVVLYLPILNLSNAASKGLTNDSGAAP